MPMSSYILLQFLLLFVLFFASIYDIKERKLVPIIPMSATLLIGIILSKEIGALMPAIGFWILINAGITILLCAFLYAINIWRSRKGKSRLIGGGDIITYAIISLTFPVSICGLTAVWLIPASIVLAALAGFIPKIAQSHEKRGIPHIVYLSVAYAAGVLLQTAALYIV